MSVVIKGVKMPMHCAMCGFHGAMGDPMISQHFCKVTGVSILNPYKGRRNDCPLVPVPPHGRLIDADALIVHCKEMQSIEWNNKASPYSWAYAYENFESDIEDAPTILEAEVEE